MAVKLNDHPVVAQLNSFKAALDRVQDELQRNSIKLQGSYLKASDEHDRIQQLEQENRILTEEIEVLRNVRQPDRAPPSTQVQQLTLSLRKLSDQLSLTEQIVLTRTNDFNNARSDAARAKLAEDKAYELAARIRGREESLKQRERELEHQLRVSQEAGRMADLAVNEYANLVRAIDGGKSVYRDTAEALAGSFAQGKEGLKRLMLETHEETENLERRFDQLQSEYAVLEAQLDAQKKAAELDREARSQAELELERLRVEDNTAAKMVSRYMKFSQAQTDHLQAAMAALKTRHSATIDSLTSQTYNLNSQLHASQQSLERFRSALDELGGDIMKESFGRRNEVALRIRMVSREERLSEQLHRWLRRAEEALSRLEENTPEQSLLQSIIQEAEGVALSLESQSIPADDEVSGSLGRVLIAQYLVDELKKELQYEKSLHLQLRRMVLDLGGEVPGELLPEDEWVPPDDWMSTDIVGPPPKPRKRAKHPARPSKGLKTEPSSLQLEDTTQLQDITHVHEILAVVEHNSEPSLANIPTNRLPPVPVSESCDPVDPSASGTSVLKLSKIAETTTEVSSTHPPSDLPLPDSNQAKHAGPILHVEDGSLILMTTPAEEAQEELSTSTATTSFPEPLIPTEMEGPTESIASDDPVLPLDSPAGGDTTTAEGEPATRPEISAVEDVPPLSLSEPTVASEVSIPTDIEPHPASIPSSPSSHSAYTDMTVPPVQPPPKAVPHSLLESLKRTKGRYDDLQRGFRDCHLSLQTLRESLTSPATPGASLAFNPSGKIPREVLQVVLDRLNDFVEDARVELEIQISDEELLAQGYETLLAIPGAISILSLSSASAPSSSSLVSLSLPLTGLPSPGGNAAESSLLEVEQQIALFIAGTDSGIRKARGVFERKLEDAQHDIAALKKAIHDPDPDSSTSPSLSSPSTSPSAAKKEVEASPSRGLLYPTPRNPALPSPQPSSTSSSWTSWIRNASSPSSLSPSTAASPATFGNIMTSPRLRHSPSLQSGLRPSSPALPLSSQRLDPLENLGLRVPMPKFAMPNNTSSGNAYGDRNVVAFPGQAPKRYEFNGGVGAPMSAGFQRTRATSAMYMLGLGGGAQSPGLGGGIAGRTGEAAAMSHQRQSSSPYRLSPASSPSTTALSAGRKGLVGSSSQPSSSKTPRVERDIDGETDIETDPETEEEETETETEDEGSDTDIE